MNAAANGPNSPNSISRSASADEICASVPAELLLQRHDQDAGRAIAAAVTSVVRSVAPTMTQP